MHRSRQALDPIDALLRALENRNRPTVGQRRRTLCFGSRWRGPRDMRPGAQMHLGSSREWPASLPHLRARRLVETTRCNPNQTPKYQPPTFYHSIHPSIHPFWPGVFLFAFGLPPGCRLRAATRARIERYASISDAGHRSRARGDRSR